MSLSLCPSQQQLFDRLLEELPLASILVVQANPGLGNTTLLREIQNRHGGIYLSLESLPDLMRSRHPLALEETLGEWILQTLSTTHCVLLDGLQHILNVVFNCNSYPRSSYFDIVLDSLATRVVASGKKLILGNSSWTPSSLSRRGRIHRLDELTVEDYAFLIRTFLGDAKADPLDFARIHRFAPALDIHQLKGACTWHGRQETLDTEGFIEYLRSQHLVSNVDLSEVQKVQLHDLHGIPDVIEALEANVVLPLENDQLALELGLKPKRGVLLLGPPGTGKTTVGRALAHRLQGKFFLIDGTIISGTSQFYWKIDQIFNEAKHNAPSVIFIDDSDVIFESGAELGLYRYLLTMLDGLESASATRVCVMMTAMDVASIPPALLRSGRVELWLEMQLPDRSARRTILERHLTPRPALLGEVNLDRLSGETDGFTGADLKRLAEDGKLLLANDKVKGRNLRPGTEYFLEAIGTLRANKARYAEADAHAREKRPHRPVYFAVGNGSD